MMRRAVYAWGMKKFGKSRTVLRVYMAFRSDAGVKPFKNLQEFRHAPKSEGGLGRKPQGKALRGEWAAPIDAVAERARREADYQTGGQR
jgi:hypothetical protein